MSWKNSILIVAAGIALAVLVTACALPFDYSGEGAGKTISTDPSTPNVTAPVTFSYAEEGGASGSIADGGAFYSNKTTTVTLSTATQNAVIYYTDDGGPLTSLSAAKRIGASSGQLTVSRTTDVVSLDIQAVAVGPGMLPSPKTQTIVGVSAFPIITVSADNTSITEDGGTATFTLSSSQPFAGDLSINLSTSGNYEASDVAGLPGPGSSFAEVLPANTTSITIPITGQPDEDEYENDTVTLTVEPGSDYVVGALGSADVVVADSRKPVLTLSANRTSMLDGQSATFTVSASVAPDTDLVVNIDATGFDPGRLIVPASVTLPGGSTSVSFTVSAPAEVGYELQAAQIALGTDAGYIVGTPSSRFLQVADDVIGVFDYVGFWDFDAGSLTSPVGLNTTWNISDESPLVTSVTGVSGLLQFDGTVSNYTEQADVSLVGSGESLDKSKFTVAVRFRMPQPGPSRVPIIVGGQFWRWLRVRNNAGSLQVVLNNDTPVTFDTTLGIPDQLWSTVVVNVDTVSRVLSASLNGSAPQTLTLPAGFSWEVEDANGPTFDERLLSNDHSTAEHYAGDWDWVFVTNGILSQASVDSLVATDPDLQ